MNLRKLIFTNNACYKAGRTITPKGIMVHSTGADNPNLKRYVGLDDGLLGKNPYSNHWNQATPGGLQVCVHGFIGKLADGSIATYQTLPWNYRGWHGGSGKNGSVNDTHISFEICEDDLTDAAYFKAVYKEATELCAYLCKQYGLTEKSIICHSEGHNLGLASNHADVMHWFPKHGKSMDTFRADVAKLLEANKEGKPPAGIDSAEKTIWNALSAKGLNSYAIAGIMGNLYAESALKPINIQNSYEGKLDYTDDSYTAAVDSGVYTNFVKDGAGYGLAQWTFYTRKHALLESAKSAGKSIGDLGMQLEFLWKELQGYASLLNALKSAASAKQASDAFLTEYERPADQSDAARAKRAVYAQGYYDKYDAKVGAIEPPTFTPYLVTVTASALNIRKGAGTGFAVVGSIKNKGTYTIVAEAKGAGAILWGKLKSGAGWVSLDYCQRR